MFPPSLAPRVGQEAENTHTHTDGKKQVFAKAVLMTYDQVVYFLATYF